MTREEFYRNIISGYRFIQTFKKILSLTSTEAFLLLYFDSHNPCTKGKELLLEETDLSESSFDANKKSLIKKGLLICESGEGFKRKGGTTNLYKINYEIISKHYENSEIINDVKNYNIAEVTEPPPEIHPPIIIYNNKKENKEITIRREECEEGGEKSKLDIPLRVMELWNDTVANKKYPNFGPWKKLTKKRIKLINETYKTEFKTMEGFRQFICRITESDFLAGRKKTWNCDLEWCLKEENLTRIIEGKFDNKSNYSSENPFLENSFETEFKIINQGE